MNISCPSLKDTYSLVCGLCSGMWTDPGQQGTTQVGHQKGGERDGITEGLRHKAIGGEDAY